MMFEKGKRERQQSQEDKVFNRMLLWLAGAVAVELLLLLLRKVYVDMIFGGVAAMGLFTFFRIFTIAGLVIAAGCVAWAVFNARGGKSVLIPVIVAAASMGLWLVSFLCSFVGPEGIGIAMMFPAAAAVLIIIFFLYQRPFFYNAILTGGGLLALWLHGKYYTDHPRLIIVCFAGGIVVLAAAAALVFRLRQKDGKLGKLRVLPPSSNYMMTWITCGVTAAAMVLGLILGVSLSYYLLYVLVGWLFAQAVFFTVKMM